MWQYVYADELYHHGIKGQRWGVRRFQRSDGSLTPAGKKRYYDTPELQSQKDDYNNAAASFKSATNAYNQASNNYMLKPTAENKKALADAESKLLAAGKEVQRTKLRYDTNKEVARINSKGITFKNKSKHRQKLEEEYKKLGMTDEQAQAAANKRIRTEKILATAATVTVAACAAYAVNKVMKDRIDGVIKAGESLQRIEMTNTDGKLHDVFYTSKGKHDNARYKNLLGATRQSQTGQAYLMKLQAKTDIKVASKNNAANVFGNLYKNDPDFRALAGNYVSKHFNGSNRIDNINDLSSKNIKKMYENFNANLMDIRAGKSGVDQKFYDALKKAGYGAIQDINDMKYSGYNAKNPLIVFGNSNTNKVMVNSVTEIKESLKGAGEKELSKAAIEAIIKSNLNTALPASAVALATAATATRVSKTPTKENIGDINKKPGRR